MEIQNNDKLILVCGFGTDNTYKIGSKLAYEKRVQIKEGINELLSKYSCSQKAKFFEDIIVNITDKSEVVKAEKVFLKSLDLIDRVLIHIDPRCPTASLWETIVSLRALRSRKTSNSPLFPVAIVWHESTKSYLKNTVPLATFFAIEEIKELIPFVVQEVGEQFFYEIPYTDEEFEKCEVKKRILDEWISPFLDESLKAFI